MKGKIAVFVREEMADKLHTIADEQEKMEILPFIYHETEEIIDLVERAFICDIYLFTEPLAYLYVKDKVKKKRIPSVQITIDEYMVLNAIHKLKDNQNQRLNRLSVDLPEKQPLNMVLKDWKDAAPDLYLYEYMQESLPLTEKITAHHQQLWKEEKIDYVLTSSKDIKKQLKDVGIPVSCMEIPYTNLISAIRNTASLINLNSYDSTQVVAGYVSLKTSYPADGETIKNLKSILSNFGHKTGASILETTDTNKYALFGTKGLLDHIKNNYGTFPLLDKIKSVISTPANIAFGLGLKANQAEHHAQLALEKCQKEKESIAYVVNERGDVIGPLGVERHIDTSKLYQALIHKARLNNELSYNFIDFIKNRNNEPFSSHDVASFYNVTKRSAERTVNKLLSGEVIKVSGEERPYQKGRPRKLFTLNL